MGIGHRCLGWIDHRGLMRGLGLDLKAGMVQERTMMDESLVRVEAVRAALDALELHAPTKGSVKELLVMTHSQVEAGEVVLLIDPKDHFYLFNKSLAIFSFIAVWIFLGLYVLAH